MFTFLSMFNPRHPSLHLVSQLCLVLPSDGNWSRPWQTPPLDGLSCHDGPLGLTRRMEEEESSLRQVQLATAAPTSSLCSGRQGRNKVGHSLGLVASNKDECVLKDAPLLPSLSFFPFFLFCFCFCFFFRA